ncbi:MAG: S-layer homology domain-containing protein [Paenisporosarcina sp.]|nr:S-layer homology domain-containing protein [Paenisporosarcina sp.]
MRKFIISLLTILIAIFTISSTHASASSRSSIFDDYAMHNKLYESVYSMYLKEVIEGVDDIDGFKIEPFKPVTRADAAYMIYQLLGLTFEEGLEFKDVPIDHLSYDAIQSLSAKGVIHGFEDLTFRPDDLLTRAQMSKVIASAFEYEIKQDVSVPFTDVNMTFKPFVYALFNNGITTGVTPTQFASNKHITRQEMSAFMDRAYKKIPGSDYNEYEVLNAVNEATRKVKTVTLQGLEKHFPKLSSMDVTADFEEITIDPYTSWAVTNYLSVPCYGCDIDLNIRDFDFALDYTIVKANDTSIVVHAIAPDSYFFKGYRGTIELVRVGDVWKTKSLVKTTFDEYPLNLSTEQASAYLTYAIPVYWREDVESINYIGKDSNSDYSLFLVNDEITYFFNLNTGQTERQ